ncbi:UDP-N-acetylmuramate:L-alanyl-gamma-D-glutamyl-meso-diaminopimelate ligase [Orrella marina]|uniref:UDP-N-acetylmuramate--L-alanyl-gamma-D-glutamyl-meso-2,6-diaminoheptandioate ligase n=1 Tax=Orrella marina TaxID=2163011 RepID=A0A2R4XN70_9BURK|nr:UDP-N-acetylmuramate:L-alanyl-gamma-D-glutamyl-meso-diaminopimelate ligase [Orrella marina]AWB35159.1 UDP-N-acetylmuramate:L-alanyl-gamma-D-glutamyl-meso-diaminopimelate ligase [Orrella marina]
MHLHILGICGTFMGGLALVARSAGHRVTGCDQGVYPPMSTQLAEQGIELVEGFSPDQISLKPDLFVIGNVVTRGNPLMETILDQNLPYVSGPQWLGEHILSRQHVLAVAGTHGKTTTSSMLAWIAQSCGLSPNFLIGGVAPDLGVSAKYNASSHHFVIEADEYDTAFFDKRSKFVHYRSRTAILNNLEYDHADIFPDLNAIETQFHHLVRTISRQGQIVIPNQDEALERVLDRGCWTPVIRTGIAHGWHAQHGSDGVPVIWLGDQEVGILRWSLSGQHNIQNALAAMAAASHIGIDADAALDALNAFGGVKRRMEVRGTVRDITVYDDFAHHPSAIKTTLAGLRQKVGAQRIIAVLEPRSNTMKLGSMAAQLAQSLKEANLVFCYAETSGKHKLEWDAQAVLAPLGNHYRVENELNELADAVVRSAQPGDHIVVMSNGSFGQIHEKLLTLLQSIHSKAQE